MANSSDSSAIHDQHLLDKINSFILNAEWPEKRMRLAEGKSDIAPLAKLLIFSEDYLKIDSLFEAGILETTADSEYIQYSKKWIITLFHVSPKIFQSLYTCDHSIEKLESISLMDQDAIQVRESLISGLRSKKEGIDIFQSGFYVKEKDNAGQLERSIGKMKMADQSYADGLELLKSIMQKHSEVFPRQSLEHVQSSINEIRRDKF